MGSRDLFSKEWDVSFTTDQYPKEDPAYDTSYVESKRALGAEGNGINIFLRDVDDSASCQVDEVEEFCKNVDPDALRSGKGPSAYRRGAWLDDRSFSDGTEGGCVREYRNPLTATALWQSLKEPRFCNGHAADADRRLIYIPNLDANYIVSLAETAPFHQVAPLRDAIRKHLAPQTAIQVHTKQYVSFEMVLHIPGFVMRECPSAAKVSTQKEALDRSPRRDWIDLSSLKIPTTKSEAKFGLYKSRFSLLICGSSDRRWIGYGFVDRDFDDQEMDEDEFPYVGMHEDPIASNGGGVVDANLPIRDPRAYFLTILEIQSAKVLKEWDTIVRTVERCITLHRSRNSITLSRDPTAKGDKCLQNKKEAFDWNHDTMELITQLLDVLSETVTAWEAFRSDNGDSKYFHSIEHVPESQRRTRQSLRTIDKTFETLSSLQRKLVSLNNICQKSADTIQARLLVESNEATQHTVSTAEWTISVFSPLALAIAYFSMPQTVIPFELNFKHFLIAVVLMTAIVQLLFFIFGGGLRQWMKTTKVDGTMPFTLNLMSFSSDYLFPGMTRRRHISTDTSIEGVQLDSTNGV